MDNTQGPPVKSTKTTIHLIVDQHVLDLLDEQVRTRRAMEPARAYTRSDAIREAILEKLAKTRRTNG
jgi:hypothetical protein